MLDLKKYRALVFDLDGTLVDSRKDLWAAVNAMRDSYGLPQQSLEQVCSFIGDGAYKLVERSIAGEKLDLEEALQKMLAYYHDHMAVYTEFYPEVLVTLAKLKEQGVKLAVLTNKPQPAARKLMAELGVTDLFDLILGPEGGALKPAPQGMLNCLDKFQIPAQDTLMIGDHHTDLLVARNAKVDFAFVDYGIGHIDGYEAEHSLTGFSALLGLV